MCFVILYVRQQPQDITSRVGQSFTVPKLVVEFIQFGPGERPVPAIHGNAATVSLWLSVLLQFCVLACILWTLQLYYNERCTFNTCFSVLSWQCFGLSIWYQDHCCTSCAFFVGLQQWTFIPWLSILVHLFVFKWFLR
jgi:hypothetical protein